MENQVNEKLTASELKAKKSAVISVLAIAIITDIFFIYESSDFIIFGILGFYGIGILVYKLSSNATFLICLAILMLTYVQFLFLGPSVTTEKTAVWFVLFFIVGIWQRFRE